MKSKWIIPGLGSMALLASCNETEVIIEEHPTAEAGQSETPDSAEPADFMTLFQQVAMARGQGDIDEANAIGEQALSLTDDPRQIYQLHHFLTDTNARDGRWAEAEGHAIAGRQTIVENREDLSALLIMAAHLVSEEARAVRMQDEAADMGDHLARFLELHPHSEGWSVSDEATLEHDTGMVCPLFLDDLLLFDVYEAGRCHYWNLDDHGYLISYSDETSNKAMDWIFDETGERLTNRWTLNDAMINGLPEDAAIRVYDIPRGEQTRRELLLAWPRNGRTVAGRISYNLDEETEVLTDLPGLLDTMLGGASRTE